jgi:integrase
LELIETPRIGRKLPDTLSIVDIDRLIAAIDLSSNEGERNRAMLETLYGCGLRVSELVTLKISDLFFEEGFFEEALKLSDQILTNAPQHPLTSYLKGLIYLKDGQVDRAIAELSIIHKKVPPNPELLTNLGFAHHEKGNLSLAKSYYQEANQLNTCYLNA